MIGAPAKLAPVFRTVRIDTGPAMPIATPIVSMHGTRTRPLLPTMIAGIPKITIPMIPTIPLRTVSPPMLIPKPVLAHTGNPTTYIHNVHSRIGTFNGKSGVQTISRNPSAMALKNFFNISNSPKSLNSNNPTLGLKPIHLAINLPANYTYSSSYLFNKPAVAMPLIPFSNFEQYGNIPVPISYPLHAKNYIPIAPATADTAFESRPIFSGVSRFLQI